jgi:GT2 family glycosyltransferase
VLKASVIIPTYNRPGDLADCLESIIGQTVKPLEVIVVDDGDLKEPPLKKDCEAAGIRYVYAKKAKPGLTESRNLGIKLAGGDVIIFFDDDVILFPEYVEETLRAYVENPSIGGVGGMVVNEKPLCAKDKLRRAFERLFLLTGPDEGRVLSSGFCVDYGATGRPMQKAGRVDFLSGCAMSFRREIFGEFFFTDRYRNFGFGEDKDFSYRVAKKYGLIYSPKARLKHMVSVSMRPDKGREGRMFILGRYLFFKWHVKKNPLHWLVFYYAISGYVIMRLAALIAFPNKQKLDRLGGALCALKDIALGAVDI